VADNSKDVELRIRAKDYSQKTLHELIDTLVDLTKVQKSQLEAAEKGEVSAGQLEASYKKLEAAAKALLSQNSLVKVFEAQSAALTEAKARTEAARLAHANYQKTLSTVGEATKKQIKEVDNLAKAVTRLEAAQARSQKSVDGTAAKLERYGIAADKLTSAQTFIVRGVTLANAALAKQDAALESNEAHQRAAVETARLKAEADRQQAIAAQAAANALANSVRSNVESSRLSREQAEAARLLRVQLNQGANALIGMSQGFKTLAGSIRLANVDELSAQLRSIIDPADAAISTLDGIGDAIKKVNEIIVSSKGPIKDYKTVLQTLVDAQQKLLAMAGQINAFRQQQASVAAARAEYERAGIAVDQLAKRMRAGAVDVDKLDREMNQAKSTLHNAAEALSRQSSVLASMDAALQKAGIDTTNLTNAEKKLVAQTNALTKSVNDLGEAHRKGAAQANQNAAAQKKLGERTTLSFLQRQRGEVLSLTTQYLGLMAAIRGVVSVLDAYKKEQVVRSRLAAVVGQDQKAIDAEYALILRQSNRLGFAFNEFALSYSKFAIAAKGSGVSIENTRLIFEAFAEASRVAGLSTEDFEGSLKAVEQMMSKGQITAEELRQQLGDRLPGAFKLVADSVGVSVAELNKMLETGKVSSDYLVNVALQLKKINKDQLKNSTEQLVAAQGRLQSALQQFEIRIAKSGFADAYQRLLGTLTTFLNSGQADRFATQIGGLLEGLVKATTFLAKNLPLVEVALIAVFGFKSVKLITSFQNSIRLLSAQWLQYIATLGLVGIANKKALATSTAVAAEASAAAITAGSVAAGAAVGTAATAAGKTVAKTVGKKILGAIPFLGLVIAAGEIVSVLWNAYGPPAKEAGKKVAESFNEGLNDGIAVPEGHQLFQAAMDTIAKERVKIQRALARTEKNAAKQDLEERLDLIREFWDNNRKAMLSGVKSEAERGRLSVSIDQITNEAIIAERKKFAKEQEVVDENTFEKRKRMAEEIRDRLLSIEADVNRRAVDNNADATFAQKQAAALEDVAHEYDNLARSIEEFKRAARTSDELLKAEDAAILLADYRKARVEEEKRTVTLQHLSDLEEKMNQAIKERQDRIEAENALKEAGVQTEDQLLEKVKQINIETAAGIQAAADAWRNFSIGVRDNKFISAQAGNAIQAKAGAVIANSDPSRTNPEAEIVTQQQKINDLLEQRSKFMERQNELADLGVVTDRERVTLINQNNEATRVALIAAAERLKQAALERDPQQEQTRTQQILADMDLIIAKATHGAQVFTEIQQHAGQTLANAVDASFETLAVGIARMVDSHKKLSSVFKDLKNVALDFASSYLIELGKIILKQALLKALQGASGPFATAFVNAIGHHSGGVVGRDADFSRRVPASLFANARRMHSGGVVGLGANEEAAILKKNEEVLSASDPRNVLNGGGGSSMPDLKILNMIDSGSFVSEGVNTRDGQTAIKNLIRANKAEFRSILGVAG
jgi:tape measure domain-containing protein